MEVCRVILVLFLCNYDSRALEESFQSFLNHIRSDFSSISPVGLRESDKRMNLLIFEWALRLMGRFLTFGPLMTGVRGVPFLPSVT